LQTTLLFPFIVVEVTVMPRATCHMPHCCRLQFTVGSLQFTVYNYAPFLSHGLFWTLRRVSLKQPQNTHQRCATLIAHFRTPSTGMTFAYGNGKNICNFQMIAGKPYVEVAKSFCKILPHKWLLHFTFTNTVWQTLIMNSVKYSTIIR